MECKLSIFTYKAQLYNSGLALSPSQKFHFDSNVFQMAKFNYQMQFN